MSSYAGNPYRSPPRYAISVFKAGTAEVEFCFDDFKALTVFLKMQGLDGLRTKVRRDAPYVITYYFSAQGVMCAVLIDHSGNTYKTYGKILKPKNKRLNITN